MQARLGHAAPHRVELRAFFADAPPPRRRPPLKDWAEGDGKRLLDCPEQLHPEEVEEWAQTRIGAKAGSRSKKAFDRRAPQGDIPHTFSV
ncbi:hypothetical protein [Deinococcus hopiensis]|uniref:hypothetical protein n=1 Tax=Deinococcus hopiensis TaxID=309885 RepID=UPI00111C2DC6|nr:hypothetical protein [Deinococcus hopiensis]